MKKRHLTSWILIGFWLLLPVLFVVSLLASGAKENVESNEIKEIKVYNQDHTEYSMLEAKDAIQFSFNQLTTDVNYLFLATAALLAFIGKCMVDPIIGGNQSAYLSVPTRKWLLHSAIACGFSVFFGFFTQLYFNNVNNQTEFTIYQEIAVGILFQLLSFLLAIIFMVLAIRVMYKEKYDEKISENGEAAT